MIEQFFDTMILALSDKKKVLETALSHLQSQNENRNIMEIWSPVPRTDIFDIIISTAVNSSSDK